MWNKKLKRAGDLGVHLGCFFETNFIVPWIDNFKPKWHIRCQLKEGGKSRMKHNIMVQNKASQQIANCFWKTVSSNYQFPGKLRINFFWWLFFLYYYSLLYSLVFTITAFKISLLQVPGRQYPNVEKVQVCKIIQGLHPQSTQLNDSLISYIY